MSTDTEAPPGLAALAAHLGLAVKKENTQSDSTGDHSAIADSNASKDEEKDDAEKAAEPEAKKPAAPKGSLNSSGTIYWNATDETWTADEPKDIKPAENEETAGHAVLIRYQKSGDSRKKYEIHSLIIQSPELKIALGEILRDYPGVFCNLDRLVFPAPFEPFVHRWGALLKYMERDDLDATAKDHLQVLYGILGKELADVIKAFDDYVANGVVTFEHAWIIFQPAAVVLAGNKPKEFFGMRLNHGYYTENCDGIKVYQLSCECVDWNGKSFGWTTQSAELKNFKGAMPINQLPVFPLAFHSQKRMIKSSLIARGKEWAKLAGLHYRSYDGLAILKTEDGNIAVHTEGRIMIDADSFCKQPDQCWINVTSLDRSDSAIDPDDKDVATTHDQNESEDFQLTDYQYLLCTPLLRGYSLKSKKWLTFYSDHVSSIKWDSRAFDSLVLPASQKKLILALSRTQSKLSSNFDDVISGKGKGMILLLSGPPGVGKTLTAEAVSENMKVPLYMMSAGDLGVHPREVENNLRKTLEMVTKWKAILLIDECDVFLEARSTHDLDRNRLVSIFLRLLEYYEGTLFLTTNRVGNMDPAFQSRIHVHMEYHDLTSASRKWIWKSFIQDMYSEITDKELDELAEEQLNGRQIKNILKTASLLALEEHDVLRKDHIDMVLSIRRGVAFDNEVKQVNGVNGHSSS
ncbi:P-loop containing nucleoside triphosphate hydrolase protein [Phaeosphaeriaceae sp. PMI808]|nr:P-loop containing nucleoside triphosphate hydrolase protein [Phaeosphaeriaceae sp. PMI808]